MLQTADALETWVYPKSQSTTDADCGPGE